MVKGRAGAGGELLEPIHAVTYFAPECREAYTAAGLKGFWMGYFAGRAAPMGEVGPEVVVATFFNFHPALVERAIPDAWSYVPAAALIDVRATAAAAALRRLVPDVDDVTRELLTSLRPAVDAAVGPDRPLFVGNRAIAARDDPVEELWQLTPTLREHRCHGHVSMLKSEGLDGLEAHVLAASMKDIPPTRLQESRGWSEDDWAAAESRLHERHIGRETYERVEAGTDELASGPYEALSVGQLSMLFAYAEHIADAIEASGLI